MTLPKLHSIRYCEKCGYDKLSRDVIGVPQPFGMKYVSKNIEYPESIQKTCPQCGYQWNEACK